MIEFITYSKGWSVLLNAVVDVFRRINNKNKKIGVIGWRTLVDIWLL